MCDRDADVIDVTCSGGGDAAAAGGRPDAAGDDADKLEVDDTGENSR